MGPALPFPVEQPGSRIPSDSSSISDLSVRLDAPSAGRHGRARADRHELSQNPAGQSRIGVHR